MNKKEKNIIIVLFLLLFIVVCCLYFFTVNLNRQDLFNKQVLPVSNPIIGIQLKNEVSLVVSDKKYNVSIQKADTVYKVMQNLQKDEKNNFSFIIKEYPSLGIFVDEINGVKGGNGKYWIYEVNDKEASVGISNYIIKDGDIISWELK
jgi:hypothetical protein